MSFADVHLTHPGGGKTTDFRTLDVLFLRFEGEARAVQTSVDTMKTSRPSSTAEAAMTSSQGTG